MLSILLYNVLILQYTQYLHLKKPPKGIPILYFLSQTFYLPPKQYY